MKKVLIFVLALATVASAGLIDVVVVGHDDLDEDGVISPSDIVYIDIVNNIVDTGTSGLIAYDLDLHVSGPGTLVEVNGGPESNHQVDDWGGMGWAYSGLDLENGFSKATDSWLIGFADAGVLVSGLAIHCDGRGDVIVDLTLGLGDTGYGDPTSPTIMLETDLGDLVIEQIPEPMTIALLGLGGLFLRRRK